MIGGKGRPTNGIYFDRLIDALVGGAVGIAVMALLLPLNPLTRVERAAGRSLEALAQALTSTADALRTHDPDLTEEALDLLRRRERDHAYLQETLDLGRETAVLAPIRWRSRPALTRYVDAAVAIERATRNVRMLTRPVAVIVEESLPAPPELEQSLRLLADAVHALREDLAHDREPVRARDGVLAAVRAAGTAYEQGVGFSGTTVVAQIRNTGGNLLWATGLPPAEAEAMVR